jgi:muramidase (phage lysozyme)
MPRIPVSANLAAFLDMIAHSEGTYGRGDDGYNIVVGGSVFDSYADHPRKLVDLGHGLKSTAAGRYQVLARYFDAYKKILNVPDFSPESQDRIAIQQIDECVALQLIEAGRFHDAVLRCAHIWASLPGAGYGQKENSFLSLRQVYVAAGGALA